jgi:DivIVA domain-containing protein
VAGINPDDVARRTFSASRKGFDPIEVQGFLVSVAAELRNSRSRVLELEQELRASQQDADRNREIDPARLTALLGEETARVLDAARLAADDMRGKAAESTSRLIREATDDAARMRQEATEVLAAKTGEAEVEAAAVRRQLDELEDRARADAASQVEAGRQEGREMVAEAQKVRERMLNDLARRRKAFRQQIERLQAGRDRLLAAYDVVRDTLEVATEELQVALPEARVAAESASLRAADEDEATADELEREAAGLPEVETAATATAAAETAAIDTDGEPDAVDAVDATGMAAGTVAAAPASPDDAALELTDADVDAEPAPAGPLASSPAELEGRRSSSVNVIRAVGGERLIEGSDEGSEPGASDADADAGDPGTDELGTDESVDPDDPSVLSSLFARIRSEAEIEEANAQIEGADAQIEVVDVELIDVDVVEVVEVEVIEAPASSSDGVPPIGADAVLVARRDAALVDIERALGRRIKRELSDEQNELLDTVRRQKGVPSAEDTLPALDVHVKRYADAALASLAAAAVAGVDLLERSKAGAAPKTKAGDLATELATELVEPLRERIERCFRDAAGDDEELAQRLRACYREWKGQRVDELAARSVLAACNRGLIDGLAKGTLVHWFVDDGSTPSPDCDDNALAGDLPKGEPFPTGHVVPPISTTCRCMVVPSLA